MRRSFIQLLLVLWSAGCGSLPTEKTLVASGVRPGTFRFTGQGHQFFLQTARMTPGGHLQVLEETDFRRFFSDDSPVAIATNSTSSTRWRATGAGDDLFVVTVDEDTHPAVRAYWADGAEFTLATCDLDSSGLAGPVVELLGGPSHPVLSGFGGKCVFGGGPATDGDSWLLAGNRAQGSFALARGFSESSFSIPDTFNRFLSGYPGAEEVVVSSLDVNGTPIPLVHRWLTSEYALRGLFEEEGALLTEQWQAEGPRLVEFDAFSAAEPVTSRFGALDGWTLVRVLRPSPHATFAFAGLAGTGTWLLKRSEREGAWEQKVELTPATQVVVAANDDAVALLFFDGVGDTVNVSVQAFPY